MAGDGPGVAWGPGEGPLFAGGAPVDDAPLRGNGLYVALCRGAASTGEQARAARWVATLSLLADVEGGAARVASDSLHALLAHGEATPEDQRHAAGWVARLSADVAAALDRPAASTAGGAGGDVPLSGDLALALARGSAGPFLVSNELLDVGGTRMASIRRAGEVSPLALVPVRGEGEASEARARLDAELLAKSPDALRHVLGVEPGPDAPPPDASAFARGWAALRSGASVAPGFERRCEAAGLLRHERMVSEDEVAWLWRTTPEGWRLLAEAGRDDAGGGP